VGGGGRGEVPADHRSHDSLKILRPT